MATQIEVAVFTVGPICVMGVMIAYSSLRVYKLNDKRPVFLVILLSLMTLHQFTEIAQFASGTFYQTTSPTAEVFETSANLLAGIGSYFVLQQITELRATRNELEASNAALNERSSMVSVLNRILRHNVRNDVNIIVGRAAYLQGHVANDLLHQDLKTIEDAAQRLATISDRTQRIKQLLTEDPTSLNAFHVPDCLKAPLERVQTDAPDATITLDGPDAPDLVTKCPAMFPIAVGDVVEQIVESNSGSVNVEVSVTREQTQNESGDSVIIVIDDDGNGLPELDVQAIEEEEETPLRHGKGLSLWCLDWAVKRADGELDPRPDDETIEIRLPRSTEVDIDGQ